MTIFRWLPYFLCSIGLWLVFTQSASALSIREILGLDDDKAAETTDQNPEKADNKELQKSKEISKTGQTNTDKAIEAHLDFAEIQKIVEILDVEQRKSLLADDETFQKFIQQEVGNKSVLSAAKANKVDKAEKTIFLTQRGAENIVREFYLNQLITTKIPADFPTDQQIEEYFEKNKERFALAERVHVWQIYLAITDKMSKKEIELLKKQAESIYSDLSKNKISFSAAAQKYSDHDASKYNGGYMGLVRVNELKPEVQKPLMTLSEDKIGKPVTTDEGIHILKRGIIIPSQPLELTEVHDQIKQLLAKQIRKQLRQEIYKQAQKTYPIDLKDEKIEEWRLKLRTNLQSSTVSNSE